MNDITTILGKMQDKRLRANMLADSFSRLGMSRQAEAVRQCGTFLGIQPSEGGARIVEANFCRERLCPMCSWRRSVKIFGATSAILDYIDKEQGGAVKYLFLTLTVRNVPLERLGEQLDAMASGVKRMTNNRAWTRRVLGSMRTLEITINPDTGEAHPHYHFILAVRREYATRDDRTYWDVEAWTALWAQSCRLDYTPSVHIQRVRGRRKGIAEVSKYCAKDADYLVTAWQNRADAEAETDRRVNALSLYLKGRRLVAYSGILRQAQKALRLDPEDGPLTDCTIRGDVAGAIIRYRWRAGASVYQRWEG